MNHSFDVKMLVNYYLLFKKKRKKLNIIIIACVTLRLNQVDQKVVIFLCTKYQLVCLYFALIKGDIIYFYSTLTTGLWLVLK